MSSWEQGGGIRAGFSNCEPFELMLSASDVVAWLRHHATTDNACRIGRDLLDGSGS